MVTCNQYKAHCTVKFFLFFLSLMVLTGCKPSIDSLDVVVYKNGQDHGEGWSISIDGDRATPEPINPGDNIDIDVMTSDSQSAHVANHRFQWRVLEGDIGEWQINDAEAGELGQSFWDSYSDKKIRLTAPDGADSEITLEVTVICDEVDGPDNSTALEIKIVSESSLEEMFKKIATVWENINDDLNIEKRSLKKAAGEKQLIFANVAQRSADGFFRNESVNRIDAGERFHFGRRLEARVEDQNNNYIQDVTEAILAANNHSVCVDTLPKDYEYSHKLYYQQEKYHHTLCDHGMRLKDSLEEKCILEVKDRGTGDSIALNCNSDKDSKVEFTPYFEKHKYFVTYRLTEDEKYTLTGNVKEFPSILGYKMPATEIDCDPTKEFDICTKDIPKNQIAGVRLMLSKLYEKKHPIVCGGKDKKCKNSLISSILGKRLGLFNDRLNVNDEGLKRLKKAVYTPGDSRVVDPGLSFARRHGEDNYCRTVTDETDETEELEKPQYTRDEINVIVRDNGDFRPAPAKATEKDLFVRHFQNPVWIKRVVICYTVVLIRQPDIDPGAAADTFKFKINDFMAEHAVDCNVYDANTQLVTNESTCTNLRQRLENGPVFMTFFAVLKNMLFTGPGIGSNARKPVYNFSNYYFNNKSISHHIENGNLGNVSGVYIGNRNSMFYGASNLETVSMDTTDTVDMGNMFRGAEKFNFPLVSNWNTSQVTNMGSMFRGAKKFNQNIENWDVQNVRNMNRMFYGASDYNQNMASWTDKALAMPTATDMYLDCNIRQEYKYTPPPNTNNLPNGVSG